MIAKELISWEKLSFQLIEPVELEELKQNEQDCYLRKHRMLRKWKTKYGPHATYEHLINAAKECDDIELAHKIEEIIGKHILWFIHSWVV